MSKPRVVLVDDHNILLDALTRLIEAEFDVIATFDNCQTLIDRAPSLKPDIIVLDIGMRPIGGLSAGVELKRILPKTKLVFLTASQDVDTAAEAFRLGASGYVLKSSAGSELVQALREAIRGGYFASPALTEGVVGSFVAYFKRLEPIAGLTPRQKEVLWLLAGGMSMKQVAAILKITPRTVAFHKYSIMEQHGISSNAELITFALSKLSAES